MNIQPPLSGSVSASASAQSAAPAQKPAAAPDAPVQQPAAVPDSEQVKQALEDINNAMKSMANSLEFTIDEESKQTVVKVIDSSTGDVIRQLPSEEALKISKALEKAQGLLVQQKA